MSERSNEQKFFICEHCKNIIGLIQNKGVPLVCCGEKMVELVANTEEASEEKHIPQVEVQGNKITVKVGSVLHPMEEEHHITFIYLETVKGGQRKSIEIGEEPIVEFMVVNDTPLAVYEFCNIHKLWKTEISSR